MIKKINAFLKNRRKRKNFRRKYPKVQIMSHCYFEFTEKINFLGYCYIGPYAFWSGKGGITIGNNVIFGPKTTIWTYNHNYKSDKFIPYFNDDILKKVVVEDNVWIGLGAILMPGVTVSEGAIIGAGAVITKDVPKCAIVGGNPFRILGYRDIDKYEKLKKEKKIYLEAKYKGLI